MCRAPPGTDTRREPWAATSRPWLTGPHAAMDDSKIDQCRLQERAIHYARRAAASQDLIGEVA